MWEWVSERDLPGSAKAVIEKCEGYYDPKEYALFRARAHQENDEIEGAILWQRIAETIDEINKHTGKGKPN